MTQVTLQGREMSAQDAARIVLLEIESRGGNRSSHFDHLGEILKEWCDAKTRWNVINAVYLRHDGSKLN